MKGDKRKSALQIPPHTHLLIREAVIRGLEPRASIARRFGVSERTVENATTVDLPKARCPECGGLVILPCLKCNTPSNLDRTLDHADAR